MKWTEQDEREGFTNGWAIFDYDGQGISVIMKIDDISGYRYGNTMLKGIKNRRHFQSDRSAYDFVKQQAASGCITSRKALRICPRQTAYLNGDI